jgi:hypothetical protein
MYCPPALVIRTDSLDIIDSDLGRDVYIFPTSKLDIEENRVKDPPYCMLVFGLNKGIGRCVCVRLVVGLG